MHNVKRNHLSRDLAQAKREKDAIKIKNFNAIKTAVLDRQLEEKYDQTTLDLTTKLLDASPEFYTVWNLRRDCFTNFVFKDKSEEEVQSIIGQELKFVLLTMKRFPKCYWVWNHRIWLLQYNTRLTDWDQELQLVEMFFAADPRNFHAWQYRRIVVQGKVEQLSQSEDAAKVRREWDLKEFEYTTKMINKNISNYSAWHNRSKLIERLGEALGTKLEVLSGEIKLVQTASYTDPEDSSVWTYMRWLFTGDFFKDIDRSVFEKLLSDQIESVEELAEIERDENDGRENLWCLKTLALLQRESGRDTDEILAKLIELDPMRAQRYKNFR